MVMLLVGLSPMKDRNILLRSAEHIVHDYATLVLTGTKVHAGVPEPLNGPVEQSFHVQCRNLGNFFKSTRSNCVHDEMLAHHFIGKRVRFNLSAWTAWDRHMNTHLFHLSYDRLKNTRRWTGYGENQAFLEEFRAAWRLFLSQLPPDLRSEFDKAIAAKKLKDFPDLDIS